MKIKKMENDQSISVFLMCVNYTNGVSYIHITTKINKIKDDELDAEDKIVLNACNK
ncbi:hypothetical protein [Plasmodium yoelii yoelii]|uniref:Uncharacterized protein n=1 Tax=Plasmodium yoelii yoelii TaxID=73239 RepID=Q7RK96_PLAYO|nr:hypothetical protein [Plasmodium yoelii yoelii]